MGRILNCFFDETGEEDMRAAHYMVSMVMHKQEIHIESDIQEYLHRLSGAALPDIPFHAVDLLHGKGDYENLPLAVRKRLLVAFGTFARKLPFSYEVFSYTRYDVGDSEQLANRLSVDIESFLQKSLQEFQTYDEVALYYDGGQQAVKSALRRSFDVALSRDVAEYRYCCYKTKRLAQVADYCCAIERAAHLYMQGDVSSTYNKFFGVWKDFRGNYLKQLRKKRF